MSWRWRTAQWFELRWWKNYFSKKSKNQYLSWKRNYWERILSFIPLNLIQSKHIADIGCGPAGVFLVLQEYQVTAIDPLIDNYQSETVFFNKVDYPNVTFVKSTIEDFNTQEKFDIVFCMNAINHVHDMQKGIRSLKNMTAKDGVLIVSVDCHNHTFFKHLFRFIPADILHPHQYNRKEYVNFMRADGWKVSVPYLLDQGFFFNHYLLKCEMKKE